MPLFACRSNANEPVMMNYALGVIYFPLGFTNGSGFNGYLLTWDYGSLVRGEASLGIIRFPSGIDMGMVARMIPPVRRDESRLPGWGRIPTRAHGKE